jgi:hypothetical protein
MAIRIDTVDASHASITFSLTEDEAEGMVSVVGTFNEWTPGVDELHEDQPGRKVATVQAPYGEEIFFRYLGEGGRWFDDPDEGGRIPPIPSAKATVADKPPAGDDFMAPGQDQA